KCVWHPTQERQRMRYVSPGQQRRATKCPTFGTRLTPWGYKSRAKIRCRIEEPTITWFGFGYDVMLQKLSDQIRACHERATEAKRKAETMADPALKADYLAAVDRWMALASSYEFTDRATDFTTAMSHKQKTPDGLIRVDAQRDDAALLQEISTSLIQEGNIDALYERILDGAISLMKSDFGRMQIFHPDQN